MVIGIHGGFPRAMGQADRQRPPSSTCAKKMGPEITPTPTPAPNRGQSQPLTSVMLQHKLVTLRKITTISKPCSLRFKCLEIATCSGGPTSISRAIRVHQTRFSWSGLFSTAT